MNKSDVKLGVVLLLSWVVTKIERQLEPGIAKSLLIVAFLVLGVSFFWWLIQCYLEKRKQ